MNHAVEVSPGAIMYLSSYVRIGAAIQKLITEVRRHTESVVIA
jgi:hypothetical protein